MTKSFSSMEDLDLAVLVPDNDEELPPVGSFLVALATLLVTLAVVWWIIRCRRNQKHHNTTAKTKDGSDCSEDVSSTTPESDLDSSLEEGKHRAGAASRENSEEYDDSRSFIIFEELGQSIAHNSSSEEDDGSLSFYGAIVKWIAKRFQKSGEKRRLHSESVYVRIARLLLAEEEARQKYFAQPEEDDYSMSIGSEYEWGGASLGSDFMSGKGKKECPCPCDRLRKCQSWQSSRDDFSDIDPLYFAPGPSPEAEDMRIPSMLLPKPSSIVIPTRVLQKNEVDDFFRPWDGEDSLELNRSRMSGEAEDMRIPSMLLPKPSPIVIPTRVLPLLQNSRIEWNEPLPGTKQVASPKVATVLTKTTNHAQKTDVDDVWSLSPTVTGTVSTKNADNAPDQSNELRDIETGVDDSWSIHNLALSQYRSDMDAATTPFPTSRQRSVKCNCKKSRCLKLYCECFAAENFCQGCNCIDCYNTPENQAEREKAIKVICAKNSKALLLNRFSVENCQKVHNMGCKRTKSACLKKYCECFDGGTLCGAKCKCSDCLNFAGSQALIDKRRKIKDRSGAEHALRVPNDQRCGTSGQKIVVPTHPCHLMSSLPMMPPQHHSPRGDPSQRIHSNPRVPSLLQCHIDGPLEELSGGRGGRFDDSSSSESDGIICDDEIFADALRHIVESTTPPGFNRSQRRCGSVGDYTLSLSGKGDINDIDQSEKSITFGPSSSRRRSISSINMDASICSRDITTISEDSFEITAEELSLMHGGANEASFKSCSSVEFDDSLSFYDSDEEKEKKEKEQEQE